MNNTHNNKIEVKFSLENVWHACIRNLNKKMNANAEERWHKLKSDIDRRTSCSTHCAQIIGCSKMLEMVITQKANPYALSQCLLVKDKMLYCIITI